MTREERFRSLLGRHKRIAIAGVPRSGKTMLSSLVTDRPVLHTDDYIDAGWDGVPAAVAQETPSGPVVIEGVRALAVARLLKEPVTCVVWLDQPHESVRYTPEQTWAAKGRRTNFAKWLLEDPGSVEVVDL